jgi:hypothetical protein
MSTNIKRVFELYEKRESERGILQVFSLLPTYFIVKIAVLVGHRGYIYRRRQTMEDPSNAGQIRTAQRARV